MRRPRAARQAHKRVPEQIQPERSLEAKVTKLKTSYLRHITRGPGSLEKTKTLGK